MNTQTTPQEEQGAGKEFLVFTLAEQEYGIDILSVQEIRSYDSQQLTRLANVPEFVKGITNLRGVIVPIVDLRIKFEMDKVEYTNQTVVVILNINSRVVGIVVDGVSDVLVLKKSEISAAPQFSSTFSTEYLQGIGTIDERMLILVDIERLMTSKEMALVDAAATE